MRWALGAKQRGKAGFEQALGGPFLVIDAGDQQRFHHRIVPHDDKQPAAYPQLLLKTGIQLVHRAGDRDDIVRRGLGPGR